MFVFKIVEQSKLQLEEAKTGVLDDMQEFKIVTPSNGFSGYVLQRKECKSEDLKDLVIAISYAWGSLPHAQIAEFTPSKPPSGSGSPSGSKSDLNIKLGKEWEGDEFVKTLAVLSKDAWLWLDQLSLDQKNATTDQLNIDIPTVFQVARVLMLLPGLDCEARSALIEETISSTSSDRRGHALSSVVAERVAAHALSCKQHCIGGIDVWLRRVWPWQEFAYANRVQIRFAARFLANPWVVVPNDTFTLLSQQVLDRVSNSELVPQFADLLLGRQVEFGGFQTPTGPGILRYMSNYAEQNRVCTKDIDLVSAVAPAIGAKADTKKSLCVGVKGLIDFIESKTRTVFVGTLPRGIFEDGENALRAHQYTFDLLDKFDDVGKISFLHGAHFAEDNLLGNVDDSIVVSRFLPVDSHPRGIGESEESNAIQGYSVSELLGAMSLPQRRMMVRWLSSRKQTNNPGLFEEIFKVLTEQVKQADVTSDTLSKLRLERQMRLNSPRLFTKLSLILLRVITNEESEFAEKIVDTCELVKLQNTKSPSNTAIGYQRRREGFTSKLVAAGDCMLLVDPVSDDVCQVIGRVPFTDRHALDFRCCSTVHVLHRDPEGATKPLVSEPSKRSATFADAFERIRENKSETQFVDLSGGHVDDVGAIALSEELKANTSVKTLFLQDNRISRKGMDAIKDMLRVNKTLESVHLPYDYDREGMQKDLQKEDSRLVRWRHEQQGNWHRLVRTDTSHRKNGASGRFIDHYFKYISSDKIDVGEEAVLALAEVVKYKPVDSIQLTNTAISKRGVEALSNAFRGDSSVEKVILDANSIGDTAIYVLAQALKINKTIKELYIRENQVGIEGARALSNALAQNTVLVELNLANTNLDDECAVLIAESLKHSKTLDTLSLRANNIGNRGVRAIAEARPAIELRSLDLSKNKGISDEGAMALARAVGSKSNLEVLNLADNDIGDNGTRALLEALKIPKVTKPNSLTIRELNMSGNRIGEAVSSELREFQSKLEAGRLKWVSPGEARS